MISNTQKPETSARRTRGADEYEWHSYAGNPLSMRSRSGSKHLLKAGGVFGYRAHGKHSQVVFSDLGLTRVFRCDNATAQRIRSKSKSCKVPTFSATGAAIETAASDYEKATIDLECRGDMLKAVARILYLVQRLSGIGASRAYGVVDDTEYKALNVFVDGDGADQMKDVKINGKKLEDFLPDGYGKDVKF